MGPPNKYTGPPTKEPPPPPQPPPPVRSPWLKPEVPAVDPPFATRQPQTFKIPPDFLEPEIETPGDTGQPVRDPALGDTPLPPWHPGRAVPEKVQKILPLFGAAPEVGYAFGTPIVDWAQGLEDSWKRALTPALSYPATPLGLLAGLVPDVTEEQRKRAAESRGIIGDVFTTDRKQRHSVVTRLDEQFAGRSLPEKLLADLAMAATPGGASRLLGRVTASQSWKVLRQFKPGPPPVGRFLPEQRLIAEVIDEVDTSALARNPVGRLVNPSAAATTHVEKALVAFSRLLKSGDEATGVAVGAALDPHANRYSGRLGELLPINSEGLWGKTKWPWQDVFEGRTPVILTQAQKDFRRDFLQVLDEVEEMRVAAGLKPRAKNLEEGLFWVPRQIKTKNGVELLKPSSPDLKRHYDEALEGWLNGVRYDRDPRATLQLHVRQAYREVAEQQLSGAVRAEGITPKELLAKINPAVIHQLDDAIRDFTAAATNLRGLQNQGRVLKIGAAEARASAVARGEFREARQAWQDALKAWRAIPSLSARSTAKSDAWQKVKAAKAKLTEARAARGETTVSGQAANRLRQTRGPTVAIVLKQIEKAKDDIVKARLNRDRAQEKYSAAIASAKAATVAPGELFGRAEDTINIDIWRNRFFVKKDYDALNDALGIKGQRAKANPLARTFERSGNVIRFMSAVGDDAAWVIHGLPILARRPDVWARAKVWSTQAFFDPTVQGRFMRENLEEFQWMARHGVSIGDPEFFKALQPGQGLPVGLLLKWLERVPKGTMGRQALTGLTQQSFGRFQASYNVSLGVSRALMVRALRPGWKSTDAELAAYIRNLTGALDSRALGVGPSQRGVESLWLGFSPMLLRSTVALTVDAMRALRPGATVRQRESLRTMASLVSGIYGIYVAAGIAMEKPWHEIKRGLNPLEGKRYLSHLINGDHVGVPGQVRALIQFMAKSTAAAAPGGPPISDLWSSDPYANPLIAYVLSRGAVGVKMAGTVIEGLTSIEAMPYDNIDGVVDVAKHLGKSSLMFAIQGVMDGEKAMTTGFAFEGLRTSPATPSEKLAEAQRAELRRRFLAGEYKNLDRYDPDEQSAIMDVIAGRLHPRELGDITDQLDDSIPVLRARREQEEKQRERGAPWVPYRDANREEDAKTKGLIEQIANTFRANPDKPGAGKAFRDRLREHEHDRANAKQKIHADWEKNHPDALRQYESDDPYTSTFEMFVKEYRRVTNEAALEDAASGDFDWGLYEGNIRSLLSDYATESDPGRGEEFLNRHHFNVRQNEDPLVTELRSDREELADYWKIREKTIQLRETEGLLPKGLMDEYEKQDKFERPVWLRTEGRAVAHTFRDIRDRRQRMRDKNPRILELLLKWDYKVVSESEGREEIQRREQAVSPPRDG